MCYYGVVKIMNIWIIGIGEPLIIDSENVRLRRAGNLAKYISEKNELHYYSVSFDHYKKKQRTEKNQTFRINDNYYLHIARVPGYKRNVSLQRVISHKVSAKRIKSLMYKHVKINKPNVILIENTPLELLKTVAKFGKRNGVNVVVDFRDLWPDIFIDVAPRYLRLLVNIYIKFSRMSLKRALKNVTSVVGLSSAFMEYGLELASRNKGKFDVVIPIGYPNYNYNVTIDEFNHLWGEYGLNTEDFIIAFTGNFGKQFNFKEIILAANNLVSEESIKFVLCGSGENLHEVKRLCPSNVIFPGWVEKDMITSLLQYASVGIAPYIDSFNYRNNTPNKFGEYLSAGLPILVSVSGLMEEYLTTYKCGFRYKDGNHLAELIMNYKSSPEKLFKARREARNLYEKEFELNKINEKYYNHLINVAETCTTKK